MTTHARAARAALLGLGASLLLLAGCNADAPASTVATDAASTTLTDTTAAAPAIASQAPVISGTPATTVTVGATYLFQPTASDPAGSALSFSAQGVPSWATLDAQTGRLSGNPADTDVGQSADIVLSVFDGKSSAALPSFRIQILARAAAPGAPSGSAPPTITGAPAASVTAGNPYTFTPVGTDPDTLALTYAVTNKPAWASFSSVTGQLSGTPSRSQVGTYSAIIVSVSDGQTTVALPAFSVRVLAPPNTPPTITGTPSSVVMAGTSYAFTPTAADADKQALAFSITNKPTWATFSTATGTLSGTPAASAVGAYSGIVISVSDGIATTALPAFSVAVQATPTNPPSITGAPGGSVVAGTAYSFQPSASDPSGKPLTFSISGKPSWASFDASTGLLSGTPSAAQVGSYANIVISASDGVATASLPAFTIGVSAVAMGSATLSWVPPTQNADGTALTTLAGYRIYYGTNPSNLTTSIQLANPGITSYVVGNLASGTYYFAITAYNAAGTESALSAEGSKTL